MTPVVRLLALLALAVLGCQSEAEIANSIPRPDDLGKQSEPRLVRAVEDARQGILDSPRSDRAWGHLGNVYLVHRWESEAAACYRRAIELEPSEFRWHYYLGRALATRDSAEAVAAFAKAIELDEDYAATYVHSSLALRRLKRFQEAREHLTRPGELAPRNPYSHLHLGELDLVDGQYENARDHLKTALALNPQQSEAHSAMAQVCMALGDKAAALRHAETAKETTQYTAMADPRWGEVQLTGVTAHWFARRGNKYLQDGDIKRAISELKIAVSGEQHDPEVWLNYGTALLHAGKFEEARDALQRAVEECGDSDEVSQASLKRITPEVRGKIHTNLGVAATKLDDLPSAERHLTQAAKLDPASFDAAFNLATLYYTQGRLIKAVKYLEKARDIRPEPKVVQALNALNMRLGRVPKSSE